MSETIETEVMPPMQPPEVIEPKPAQQQVVRDLPASVEIEMQRAIAEVKASVSAAKMDPRKEDAARAKILEACQRPALALKALWTVPRGNSEATGPSIRLAEEMARLWGNLDYGIVEHGRMGGQSQQEAYCWDKESNTKKKVLFSVDHVRYTRKGGSLPLSNPQEINEVVSANSQKRVRDCILALLPRDLVESAIDVVKATRARITTDLGQSLSMAVKAFAEDFAVTQEQLEWLVDMPLARMGANELETLRSTFTLLSEDGAKVEDIFSGYNSKPLFQKGIEAKHAIHGEEVGAQLPKMQAPESAQTRASLSTSSEPKQPTVSTTSSAKTSTVPTKKGVKRANLQASSDSPDGATPANTPPATDSADSATEQPSEGLPADQDIFDTTANQDNF